MRKAVLLTGLLTMSLLAVDFSQMTTEELIALKGSVSVQERDAFRTELQSRLSQMTPNERAALRTNRQTNAQLQRSRQTQINRTLTVHRQNRGTGAGRSHR